MKEEIAATVVFITMLVKAHKKLAKPNIDKFASNLTTILYAKYKCHWYVENPTKGQAFRCIRIDKYQAVDPVLAQACAETNVDYDDLGLPKEMTIWVDPFEVCCRYGEKNYPFTIASFIGKKDFNVSSRINTAVKKITSDYNSGTCRQEKTTFKGPKAIFAICNTNNIGQCKDYFQPMQSWSQFSGRRKSPTYRHYRYQSTPYHLGNSHLQNKHCKHHSQSAVYLVPRNDRYHWVNKRHQP